MRSEIYPHRMPSSFYQNSCCSVLLYKIFHTFARGRQTGVNSDEVVPRRRIKVHSDQYFRIVENPRISKGASAVNRKSEVKAVA